MAKYKKKRARELQHDRFRDTTMSVFDHLGNRLEGRGRTLLYVLIGLIVAAHTSLGCGPLHLAGSDEQKERFLIPMASGKVIGAYGLTEPGAGSDSGGTRTTARRGR